MGSCVVHKQSCEQLNKSLDVLFPSWTKAQLVSRLDSRGSVARWTWIVDRGSAVGREPKDRSSTGYDQGNYEELYIN